jgi:signal transduction histidine kinase
LARTDAKPGAGRRDRAKQIAGYAGVVSVAFVLGTLAGWTSIASQIDNYAYDFLFRRFAQTAGAPEAVILAIDEPALRAGGMRNLRGIVTQALDLTSRYSPKVVAVDVITADQQDPETDAKLEAALARLPNVVLSCEQIGQHWEDPLPRFASHAAAVGHVHAEQNRLDGVHRRVPLEVIAGGQRRWALALEAFRLYVGQPILESPDDLEIGNVRVPAERSDARHLRVGYLAAGVPTIALGDLRAKPALGEQLRGKAVFLGVTALSGARDRVVDPLGNSLPGVEVHAHLFETMRQQRFLVPASPLFGLLVGLGLSLAALLIFVYWSGWRAIGLATALLVIAHVLPVLFFDRQIVFPYFAPVSAAWLSVVAAAAWQYFVVRKQLRVSETEKARYQQAIHFVTHEMKTPLTAIQGSSELMTRYRLNEDKQKQLAETINSESKRLAGMIQTFLNVERLSEGQMELKQEPLSIAELGDSCVRRVRPLAERKQIEIQVREPLVGMTAGDRELLEYALYNLLNNAVKYSPAETHIVVESAVENGFVRVGVRDQGIGMDEHELKNLFRKFYRTKRAEASGESGTGIGLSIVQQIIAHHGGKMEVTSAPGKGSCFTMVLKAQTESGIRHLGESPAHTRN